MSFKKSRMPYFLAILLILALPLINNCDDDNVSSPPSSNDPDCEIVPSTVEFGDVGVGTHLDKSFAIVNNSGDTLSGNVSESCDGYEIISGGGPFFLAADDIWPVTVRFEPVSGGLHECTIETGGDPCGDVPCRGTGDMLPVCQVAPSSLNFGSVTIGHYSDKTFTIRNNGGGAVTGSISEPCGHYSIVAGDGPYSLGAGDSVVVTVRFEPTSPGTRVCTIETATAQCSNVPCTGEATYPDPGMPDTVRVASLDLPLGTTEFDLRVYLHNDEELGGISLPIAWSSPDLTCEAVDFGGSRVDYIATKPVSIDNPNQRVNIGIVVLFESFVSPGSGLLCTLRFSVDPSAAQQVVIADKTFFPPAGNLGLVLPSGMLFVVNLGDAPPGTSTLEGLK